MEVALEGKIFELQSFGGISRIYHEILPRMCQIDSNIHFNFLSSGKLLQTIPNHPQITHHPTQYPFDRWIKPKSLFPALIDRIRVELELNVIPSQRNSIWHASYFNIPHKWDGPKIISIYDMIHEFYPKLYHRRDDDNLRMRKQAGVSRADMVLCISESTRQDVIQWYKRSEDRVISIPLASSSAFRVLSENEISKFQLPSEPYLLFVGFRSHHKNFHSLLEAYSRWKLNSEVSLVIVGGGAWSVSERETITTYNLSDRIQLKQAVRDEELCALYNRAVAFIYPSLYEGFGIPLLESMACRCPLVASQIPSTTEVAGSSPIYFEPLNIDSLVEALNQAVDISSRPDYSSITQKYSWDRTAHSTLDAYRQHSN